MSREPARASYDAVVDVLPLAGEPTSAYALVKRCYVIGRRGMTLSRAAPLFHDLRDPNVMPRLVPGCEFYPFKRETDVAVRGYAFAAGGRAVPERTIALEVGGRAKLIDVVGRRVVTWSGGRPRFSAPEPFVRVPVTWREAYGGVDPRVPFVPEPGSGAHPGVYPRNPLGKGFVVLDAPVEVELPNLEDPAHRLTEDTLVVGDPATWWRQPLPWCFEYTLPLMFPRRQWLGAGAALRLGPDATLEEVQRGFLSATWREESARVDESEPPAVFYQEGPFGQRFEPLVEGVPIRVRGMSPERDELTVITPAPPAVELSIDGHRCEAPARLGTVLLEPHFGRVSFVWIAQLDALPVPLRMTAPGRLPLSVRVDGDTPIPYQPPAAVLDFVDPTAPLVEAATGIPRTGSTRTPEARSRRATTLRLTEAQLRGEEPVPLREDTSPRVSLADVDLVLEGVGPMAMEDEATDIQAVDALEPPSGRITLVDPDDL